MPTFERPTYIVLDVPEPFASEVKRLRAEVGDHDRLHLPSEITVIGSSGVGTIAPENAFTNVVRIVDTVARELLPFETRFGPMAKFPGTEIRFLSLPNREPFDRIHIRLRESGLTFGPMSFPYTPHCTISGITLNGSTAARMTATWIPGIFRPEALSIYQLDGSQVRLLHRTPGRHPCSSPAQDVPIVRDHDYS